MHLPYGISFPLQMFTRNRISPLKNVHKSHIEMTKTLRYTLPLWLFRDKTLKQTLDLTCELGTVEQNSLTPNSRIYEALES